MNAIGGAGAGKSNVLVCCHDPSFSLSPSERQREGAARRGAAPKERHRCYLRAQRLRSVRGAHPCRSAQTVTLAGVAVVALAQTRYLRRGSRAWG